jgi:hypothetical protein
MNTVFDQTAALPLRRVPALEARLPYRLAVPIIIGLSLGLWMTVWKLGTLALGLVG